MLYIIFIVMIKGLKITLKLFTLLLILASTINSWCLFKTYFQLSGSSINQVDWSPDGNFIVVASTSKRATVLSFITSNVVWYANFSTVVNTAKFSPKGNWMAIGLEGNDSIQVYRLPGFTHNISASFRHQSTTTGINQLDFDYNQEKIVTCGDDGYVNQRDMNTLHSSSRDRQQLDADDEAISCKYSTQGKVGSSSNQGKLYLHDSDLDIDQQQQFTYSKDIDFRPNTDRYIYGGCTCSTKIHEFDTNDDTIRDFIDTVNGKIWTVSHSPDQSFLAAGGQNGYFYIINTINRSSRFFQAKFKNSTAHINSVRVSDDSNFVAVGRSDGVLDIYARVCLSSCPMGHYFKVGKCSLCASVVEGCAICRGCRTCSTEPVCTSCFPSYYLDNKKCQKCSESLEGCQTCKSNSVCLTCLSTYYISGNTCKSCNNITSNCQQCLSNSTCLKCSYYYYLTTANTCSLCKQSILNCLHCSYQSNSTSLTGLTLHCVQCTQGYYASLSLCLPCHQSCLQCINNGSCIACKQEYRMNGTLCVFCPLDCQSCLENGTCLQCAPTTYFSSGNCLKCTAPCLTCRTTANSCLSCVIGFYLSGTNTCSKCSAGCAFCNPFNGTCLTCPFGQYLSASNICSPCLNSTSYCSVCSSSGCLFCQRNYYLSGSICVKSNSITNCDIYQKNSNTICDSCSLGFYLNASGNCIKCQNNCFVCDNSSACSQCQIGYYLNNTEQKCLTCVSPCVTCTSQISCLTCGQQYYLSGSQCLKCWVNIPYCNACLNQTHCLNCFLGYKLAPNNTCISCSSPCSSCNQIGCLSCELGYFLQLTTCSLCPQTCSSCSSASICSQCVPGYSLNGTICIPCETMFPDCKECSFTKCFKCKNYFYLNENNFCLNCATNISHCLECNQQGRCDICQIGYYRSNNGIGCQSCNASIINCQKCFNSTDCDECSAGFYYQPSIKNCQKCIKGCSRCNLQGTCEICQSGFMKVSGICKMCGQQIFGCRMCNVLNNCINCTLGYYLSSSTSCVLCKNAMPGCISCSSISICDSCDLGFYLNSSKQCQPCPKIGCATCNQTNLTCFSCLSGYYLKNIQDCQQCSVIYPNCKICNSSWCFSCETGYYLDNGVCKSCKIYDNGCLFCNSTACLQCSSGKYLHSNQSCQICSISGCQICDQSGNSCLQCENLYFNNGPICNLCSVMNEGCLSCRGLNNCNLCQKGYYLELNSSCNRCISKYDGCQICNAVKCLTCKTNYFYNVSSSGGDCILCKRYLSGCSLCINQYQCLLCESGYYLSNFTCKPCSQISQCYICQDNTTCLFCAAGYYLKSRSCNSCAQSIPGCLNCVSQFVCSSCSGNYQLSGSICTEIKRSVSAKKYGTQIRLVSQYLNSTNLKHTLHSSKWQFTKVQQQWQRVTKIQLIKGANKSLLTIYNVQWLGNSLVFLTNNPYGQISSPGAKGLPLIGQFTRRRMLFSLSDLNIQTDFQMKRATINELLPQLDTNGQDLQLQYKLDGPQFYKSIVMNEKYYYHIFGIVVTVILVGMYLIKICFVIPSTLDSGSIIPHIMMLKIPAMVIYPTLGGYINYCYGFTMVDFPWLNDYFSKIMSSSWELSPPSFKIFYNNLNISSTYLLALIIFLILYIPLQIYSFAMKQNSKKVKNRIITGENQSEISELQPRKKVHHQSRKKVQVFKSFIYNLFISGLTFSSVSTLVGMSLNPTSIISSSGVLYLSGILIYTILFVDALRTITYSVRKIRTIIKGTLMTLIFISPVPLFTTVVVFDLFMMVFEYKKRTKQLVLPKVWIINQILVLISYSALIFLSNMMLGIILCSICVIFVLGCDIYLQYFEYLQDEKIDELKRQKQYSDNNNFTIQEFMPSKKEDESLIFHDPDEDKDKQKRISQKLVLNTKLRSQSIASSQNRFMKSQQIKEYK